MLPVTLDVTDSAAVAALPGSLPDAWQEVDVLVNNAGLALGLDPAYSAKLRRLGHMIATNISGLVHVTRALLPGMVARNRGHVVNLGSTAGSYPYRGRPRVWRLKGFREAVHAESLKTDLVGTNVRVTDIEAGAWSAARSSAVSASATTPRPPPSMRERYR